MSPTKLARSKARFGAYFLMAIAAFWTGRALAFVDVVQSVGTDSIVVITGAHEGVRNTAIDSNGDAVAREPGNVATYTVNAFTTITVDGLPSKLSDVMPNMKVDVSMGTDRNVAASITAFTVPPLKLDATASGKKASHRNATHALGRGVSGEIVLSINADRITVGELGAGKASAYLITPVTTITVNGTAGKIEDVRPGMAVRVTRSGTTTAGKIDAKDASN